jgi:hypothetical protein
MNIEDSLIVMSDEIYSCTKGLVMPVPQLQMMLKSNNAFMGKQTETLRMQTDAGEEMSLDATPTFVVCSPDLEGVYRTCQGPAVQAKESIFVEGEDSLDDHG